MECKRIVKYLNDGLYCVLVPVYYEFEKLPAWRKYFIGKKEECVNIFVSVPDYLNATADENKTHKHYIIQEYNFYISIGKTEKANNLKKQYTFI